MNKSQAQAIIDQAIQGMAYDYDAMIVRLYPNRTDLDKIELGVYTLPEFVDTAKHVFGILIHQLDSREYYLPLPAAYNHPAYGQGNVDAQIQSFVGQLNGNNIPAAENILQWLVGYLLSFNLYELKTPSNRERIVENLGELSERLTLIQKSIENYYQQIEVAGREVENLKKELQTLINQKRDELASITASLTTSTTQTNQIGDLLNKSTEQSTKIEGILARQEEIKTQSEHTIAELEGAYTKSNADLTGNLKVIAEQIETFKVQTEQHAKHLEFVEGKRGFFEERIKYLQDLIGQEVGANLFKTFKLRKDELESPVNFWKWAVPVMSVVTILWVLFLFSNQSAITNLNLWWQAFAVNTLKSVPAVILLLFTINQYRKERNFQEAYAFKSAVALTIDAYAGRLSDVVNKDKMIMESVAGIYRTPIEEKQSEKVKTKTAMDTIKSMAETTKELAKAAKE